MNNFYQSNEILYVPNRDKLVSILPGERAMELGVWFGDFSDTILRNSSVKELWLVDCWSPYPDVDEREGTVFRDVRWGAAGYLFVNFRFCLNQKVRIVRGLIEDVLPIFKENSFDWIYIDAGHKYEMVKRHLELSYPLVKPGGYIAGHDYLNTEPFVHLVGVKKAVDEFCEKNNLKISILSLETCGSFAIRKPFN
ncbi:MAG: class I SAM-dependent methyltransferase [Candidatus Caldarchaeum sp.]